MSTFSDDAGKIRNEDAALEARSREDRHIILPADEPETRKFDDLLSECEQYPQP